MNALDVFLHDERVGILERRPQAKLRFTYSEEWVAAGGASLSLRLPPRAESFDERACAPFFAGLLPEGEFLKAIARAFHVSAGNPFALLAEIGGECAGAVSLAAVGASPPGLSSPSPRWLDDAALSQLLEDLPRRPLLVGLDEDGDDGIRLSLAGTHDKLGVLYDDARIGLTRGAPPSTHILKMPIAGAPDAVANEAFCMELAAQAGLNVAEAWPCAIGRHEYLLVRRFDRVAEPKSERGDSGSSPRRRIHQEDFCQALGFVPALKYENEGGPDVARCARLLRATTSAPARDLIAFLDALFFNYLIGNHDAHSKNYSLLLEGPEGIRLAPLYDLMSTRAYEGTSKKLAMKYGGEYKPEYVRGRHLDRLAANLEVKPSLVRQRAARLIERTDAATEPARAALPADFARRPLLDEIVELIVDRSRRLSNAVQETR